MHYTSYHADTFDDILEQLERDEEVSENCPTKRKNNNFMKTNFLKNKHKKQKISKGLLDNIEFGNITDFMNMENGNDAYVSAYSEESFFSYKYQKLHGIFPDLIMINDINSEKFIEDLIKHSNIPIESYFKSIQNAHNEYTLNSFIFSVKESNDSYMYFYITQREISIYYDKKYEKEEDSIFYFLLNIIKAYQEPKISKNKIYVVYQSQNGFEKTGFEVKKIDVNLEENYNDGFPKISEEIITGLNNSNKTSLVILSGDPGTGKCVTGNTKITVRDKKTGEVKEINIEDLM